MRALFVDGYYYLYRSFYAIRDLTNARGEPTNAIYGFAKALRKMLADLRPEHTAVIWDCGLPARRTRLQPQYKQNRPPMPDALRPQVEWLRENVPLFGPASLFLADTEADDLIASYVRAARQLGMETVIATNDKDILQLVGEGVSIYSTAKADVGSEGYALLGAAEVEAKWGVCASQIGDVLALTGDASDNIPGIPGVGIKTAARLIREFGGVEALLACLGEVLPESLREKLAAGREAIFENRQMVALDENLPLPQPVDQLPAQPQTSRLISALRDCGFQSLLREIEREGTSGATQGSLFE